MQSLTQNKHNMGFSFILGLFTIIYTIGIIYFVLAWLSVQSYDQQLWSQASLPFYALVFLIGAVSLFGIWKWKKWGVYGMAGTWVLTGILNLVFDRTEAIPYWNTFLAALLVIAFFLLLLPDWQKME